MTVIWRAHNSNTSLSADTEVMILGNAIETLHLATVLARKNIRCTVISEKNDVNKPLIVKYMYTQYI